MATEKEKMEYLKKTKEFHQKKNAGVIIVDDEDVFDTVPGYESQESKVRMSYLDKKGEIITNDYTAFNYDQSTDSIALPTDIVSRKGKPATVYTVVELDKGKIDFEKNPNLLNNPSAVMSIIQHFPRAVETMPAWVFQSKKMREAIIDAIGFSLMKRYGFGDCENLNDNNVEFVKEIAEDNAALKEQFFSDVDVQIYRVMQETELDNGDEDEYMKNVFEAKMKEAFPSREISYEGRHLSQALLDANKEFERV